MSLKKSDLQRIIKEELTFSHRTHKKLTPHILIESLRQRGYIVETTGFKNKEELGDSVDSQVDEYLSKYEKSAGENKTEAQRFLRDILNEADEDEEKSEEEPAEDEEEASVETVPKQSLDDLNVESFANDVARLIANYDNLLEINSTILTRATNFLIDSYDDEVVRSFQEAMREQHGLMAGKTSAEVSSDSIVVPSAGAAGPVE